MPVKYHAQHTCAVTLRNTLCSALCRDTELAACLELAVQEPPGDFLRLLGHTCTSEHWPLMYAQAHQLLRACIQAPLNLIPLLEYSWAHQRTLPIDSGCAQRIPLVVGAW